MSKETAKARYEQLAILRDPFLRRARECSALTIPTLIPPEGHSPSSTLPEPYQGLGSRLVVNLASKVMTALLPPGRGFFILSVAPKALIQAGESAVPEDLTIALSLTERLINSEVESKHWRSPTNTELQHLIVAGNVLEYLQPDNTIRLFPLDQYVVVREPSGSPIEIIIAERLSTSSLTGDLKTLYEELNLGSSTQNGQPNTVTLYTWLRRDGNIWKAHQELEDHKVPNTEGTYPVEAFPYTPLRWSAIAGEAYGRSKVEEHLPDLRAVDSLQKAVLEGAAMASRNIVVVRPNAAAGSNLVRKISKAKNGEHILGNPEDVVMLQFQNVGGMQFVQQELALLRQELGAAFLLGQAMTRHAERVTAEEIRMIAQELEGTLGGVYSMLSQEMMATRLNRLIYQMQANGSLPEWPAGMIEPTILTGLEALGREAQVGNVSTALQLIQGYPEDVYDYVKWDVLLKKGFTGLNLSDAVRTEDEVQALREEQMQQQMMMQAAQQAVAPMAQAAAQSAMPQ